MACMRTHARGYQQMHNADKLEITDFRFFYQVKN